MSGSLRLSLTDPRWLQEFQQTQSLLLWACQGLVTEVHHIGATALTETVARPTIDCLAGLTDLRNMNETCRLIEGLNYERVPSDEWCDEELVGHLVKFRGQDSTHEVWVVRYGGTIWERAIKMRDWLTSTPEDRSALECLKRDRFESDPYDLEGYRESKAEFFQRVISRF
ncbi:MAG: GrpB family protein [Planctomycetales bacterium]|nr:GrpB family protein [Planctomycetales bacterium]